MIIRKLNFGFMLEVLPRYNYHPLYTFSIFDNNICVVSYDRYRVKVDNIYVEKKGDLPGLKELPANLLKDWVDSNQKFIKHHALRILRGIYYDDDILIIAEIITEEISKEIIEDEKRAQEELNKLKDIPVIPIISIAPITYVTPPVENKPVSNSTTAKKNTPPPQLSNEIKAICSECPVYNKSVDLCGISETKIIGLINMGCPAEKWKGSQTLKKA